MEGHVKMPTCKDCDFFGLCYATEESKRLNSDHELCDIYGYKKSVKSVNHPAHYTNGRIECIDGIEAALTPREFIGYMKGNIIKYIWREKMKGGYEDLQKAEWYMRHLNGFCARMEKPGDVPHDASTGSAADTD